jgi:hypothetical protein
MSTERTPPAPPPPAPDWESHTTADGSRGVPDIEDTPREQAPPPGEAGDPDAPPMAVTTGEEPESEPSPGGPA